MEDSYKNERKVRINQLAKLKALFEAGLYLTSCEINSKCHTVDSRKMISVLRKRGMPIEDTWITADDGRRYKVYCLHKV